MTELTQYLIRTTYPSPCNQCGAPVPGDAYKFPELRGVYCSIRCVELELISRSECHWCADASRPEADTTRRARKEHKCDECGRRIEKGERYEYVTAKWDGEIHVVKTCEHCQAARGWLEKECGGFVYRSVLEDLIEHEDEHPEDAGLRLLVERMRVGWTDENGLMPVPEFGNPKI